MTRHPAESPYLDVVESGNGVNIRLTKCPMCGADLADEQPASHISDHSWVHLMYAREYNRRDQPQDTDVQSQRATAPA